MEGMGMNAPAKNIQAASLHTAMAAAFGEIEAATKAANNPHYKTKYADIGAVIDAIKPALIKHGLFFTQHPQPSEDGVTVETVLHHASGESLSLGSLYLPASKRDAQGFGSALTYARRYALQTAFGVPTEDDDGNAAVKAAAGYSQGGAIGQQQPKPDDATITKIISLCEAVGGNQSKVICDAYKVDAITDLTPNQANAVVARLTEKLADKAKTQTNAELADEIPY
jgi:hypothetical protein